MAFNLFQLKKNRKKRKKRVDFCVFRMEKVDEGFSSETKRVIFKLFLIAIVRWQRCPVDTNNLVRGVGDFMFFVNFVFKVLGVVKIFFALFFICINNFTKIYSMGLYF